MPFYRDGKAYPSQQPQESQDAPESSQLAPATQLERPPDCRNFNETPAFGILCSTMDRLRNEKPTKRIDTLTRFLQLWRIKVGNDFYPVIRLLLPDRDRERPVYRLKEANLARAYIEVLGLDKNGDAAKHLKNWKTPVEGQENTSGDFARVAYHEIKARSTVDVGTLTIADVNNILDKLAGHNLKTADVVAILRTVNEKANAAEQEWIIRIILKDLRISVKEKVVLRCLHPEAGTLFNVCSDLKRVCWTLCEPDIRLEKHQADIDLFKCFLPQLCHRSPNSNHDAIARLVGGPDQEFIMEEKLDGERIQLHMRGGGAQWFYCSRKAKDYTYLYGAHVGEGSLTPFISAAFEPGVQSVILDGEMMVWDPALEKYLAFGSLKTAALEPTMRMRPDRAVFDILYLNGKCLTDRRLDERKKLLRSPRLFSNLEAFKGRLEFVEERRGRTGQDIRRFLEQILEQKGEGLVVKRTNTRYITNGRSADWVKVKPEYADQMGENLDLLVLGGWWGKGGRTGKISSLLCGLRVTEKDDGSGERPKFTTFCKVGSGMTLADYEWILSKHRKHWIPFDRANPPSWMEMGPVGIDDKPDVYIEPEHSFVIAVKASEIVYPATGYGAGYTLRFPRCRYIFWDKESRTHPSSDETQDRDMWNCLSWNEFREAVEDEKKREYTDNDQGTSRKRRQVTAKRKVELFESFKGQKLSQDSVADRIFEGVTFFIPKGTPEYSKSELESIVHKHGGSFTQAQLGDNSAVVISCDDKTPRVKAQIRKGNSVVKPDWIHESIKRGKMLPLFKDFFVVPSAEAEAQRAYNMTLAEYDEENGGLSDAPETPKDQSSLSTFDKAESLARERAIEYGMGTGTSPSPPPRSLSPTLLPADDSDASSHREAEDHEDVEDEGEEEELAEGEPHRELSPTLPRRYLSPTLPIPSSSSDAQILTPNEEEGYQPLFPVTKPGEKSEFGGNAMEHDEDSLFASFSFYMDTPENAELNGLPLSTPPSAAMERLDNIQRLLIDNGGRIVTKLQDATHVIMDDEDSGRYVPIVRKTATLPKRKYIVTPSWVEECVDEDTLVDEDAHKPK